MKRIMLVAIGLCCTLGCERRPPTQEEKAIAASRALIATLATIGRPVRKREEITRLGFYAKQARARIQKERDAVLKKAASQ